MPVFFENELIAYTAIKAHWLDIAGKEPYSTDTVDVFQEGTVYPGVKLYSKGELVRDIYNMCIANSRVPNSVAGDINAQAIGVRTGERALKRVVAKYGLKKFREAVEEIFDAGEKIVRNYLRQIPNGEYFGSGQMDSNGVEDGLVPFEVKVIVKDDSVVVDMSEAPPQQNGPINCPLPSTVSTARVAMSMLAGSNEAPNEGFFRPIEVITKKERCFIPLHQLLFFCMDGQQCKRLKFFIEHLDQNFLKKFQQVVAVA